MNALEVTAQRAAAVSADGAIRVLIVEDQALVRRGFRLLVDSAPGMITVGEAENGLEAIEQAVEMRPDVILMDIRMPDLDGIEATRRICGAADGPAARVLILTTFDVDENVFSALRAGASGFLVKDTPPAELLRAIRTVAAGEALLSPSVTRRLISEFVQRPARRARPLDGLTSRERDVLVLIAQGLSNDEIAEQLHLVVTTVKTHIGRLLAKLHARDRAQLVIAAYESGLANSNLHG